jgi:uncharacterized membrane protein YeaQ/YmgE (transglycosylase-associated protein family)
MDILHLIYILVIGFTVGFFAKRFMRGDAWGLGGDLGIGVLGSFAGWALVAMVNFRNYGILDSITGAIAGALFFLYTVRMFNPEPKSS